VLTVSRARWHQTKTAKGIFGELSKVIEQYAELVDTVAQAQPVMTLIEPSDLIGAIDGVLARRGRSVLELAPSHHQENLRIEVCVSAIGRFCRDVERHERDEAKLLADLREIVFWACVAAYGYRVNFDGLTTVSQCYADLIFQAAGSRLMCERPLRQVAFDGVEPGAAVAELEKWAAEKNWKEGL
jgi:hypothetical protein